MRGKKQVWRRTELGSGWGQEGELNTAVLWDLRFARVDTHLTHTHFGPFTGHPAALAPVWGALVIGLEHRFYGLSIPAEGLDMAKLRFLSSRHAWVGGRESVWGYGMSVFLHLCNCVSPALPRVDLWVSSPMLSSLSFSVLCFLFPSLDLLSPSPSLFFSFFFFYSLKQRLWVMNYTRCFTQHHCCVIINISTGGQRKGVLNIFIMCDVDFVLIFFFKEK